MNRLFSTTFSTFKKFLFSQLIGLLLILTAASAVNAQVQVSHSMSNGPEKDPIITEASSGLTSIIENEGKPAPAACGSAPKIAADLWQAFERKTKEAGCYVDWKPSTVQRYAACQLEFSKLPAQLAEEMIGFWNSMAKNQWATIGPRRVEHGRNRGTLASPGNRLWLTSTPKFMGEMDIEVEKRKATSAELLGAEIPLNTRVEVTVCSTNPEGETKILEQETVLAKEDAGTVLSKSISDPEPGIVSVFLKSKAKVPLTFKYELEVNHEPKKFYAGPVDGFADLHVHQMADEGYAGLWYWGDHSGMGPDALKPDDPLNIKPEIDGIPANTSVFSEALARGIIKLIGNAVGARDEATDFYTHSIPDVFGPTAHMNIAHGEPDGSSLDGWPRYDDVAHQQVNAQWLKEAHEGGLDLIVVSMVNFQAVCKAMRVLLPEQNTGRECGDMENVKRQLEAAQEMDQKYDWYEIAVHPWHARKIISEGKLAVVLSMEVSRLLPPFEGDFINQLEELRTMGLRTMQLAHETNSRFAGAAPHKWFFDEIFETIKHPLSGQPGFNLDDAGKNKKGLTDKGERLLNHLMDRHMPVDIAHLSEEAVRDVYGIAEDRDYYPLYDSHTRLKGILTEEKKDEQREFLTTCEQAKMIEKTGGMIGLRTGDTDLKTYKRYNEYAEQALPVVENNCPGSARSFAQLVEFAASETGLEMGFGSDFNGFITQVGPRFGPEACHRPLDMGEHDVYAQQDAYAQQQHRTDHVSAVYREIGLSHIGMLPDLLADLDELGTDVRYLEHSAEAFLTMWERAWADHRGPENVETDCSTWNREYYTERKDSVLLPTPMREIDGKTEMKLQGVVGPSLLVGFKSGKINAGSFQRGVSFEPVPGEDLELHVMRLRRVKETGLLEAGDVFRHYSPGEKIENPGRYTLETVFLDSKGRTLVGHVFFRVVPNPDVIRSKVDFDLTSRLNYIGYDWDDEQEDYVYINSNSGRGVGTGTRWHFRGQVIPDVQTDDILTVQNFYVELNGSTFSPGDSVQQTGDHMLDIYACYNAHAQPCKELTRYEPEEVENERQKRTGPVKEPRKSKEKDTQKDNSGDPLLGMIKVASVPFHVEMAQMPEQPIIADDVLAPTNLEGQSDDSGNSGEGSKGEQDTTTDRVQQSQTSSRERISLSLVPRGGLSMPGVRGFGDIAGEIGPTFQGNNTVFTWGGSLEFGRRDGLFNFRVSALYRNSTVIPGIQNNELIDNKVEMSFTALTGDLLLRPLPRFWVQPYAIGGFGTRRFSWSDSDIPGSNVDSSWKPAAQVGLGIDVPIGDKGFVIALELTDYISNFSGEGDLRHDAFMFGVLGIPIF